MKHILLGFLLLLAATLPVRAETASVALAPVPYDFVVPQDIAARLSTGPLTGSWAAEVARAGALASVLVSYQPESGERTILFSAYAFPADKWDAAQKPDEPPPFGTELLRADGRVLSVAGPLDVIFDPDSADGQRVIRAAELLRDPKNFRRAE